MRRMEEGEEEEVMQLEAAGRQDSRFLKFRVEIINLRELLEKTRKLSLHDRVLQ